MALLSPSSIQYSWVVGEMIGQLSRSKSKRKKLRHPLLFYTEICKQYGLRVRGGRNPHFQCQSDQDVPTTTKQLKEQMNMFQLTVNDLNDGGLLNKDGIYVHLNKVHGRLKGVGEVSAISFASLYCFVGLGTTKYAIQTAKQAPVNNKSPNNYFLKLVKALEVSKDKGNPSMDPIHYFNIWKALWKSIGQTIATIENTICAMLRSSNRDDNFVPGQDLYDFREGCTEYVYVKAFNSNVWQRMEFIGY